MNSLQQTLTPWNTNETEASYDRNQLVCILEEKLWLVCAVLYLAQSEKTFWETKNQNLTLNTDQNVLAYLAGVRLTKMISLFFGLSPIDLMRINSRQMPLRIK